MVVSSFNPQILPGASLNRDEHRKIGTIAVIVIILAIIFAVIYWTMPKEPVLVAPVVQKRSARSEIVDVLSQSSIKVSAQDVNRVTSVLSKSVISSTAADRAKVAGILSGISEQ